MRVSSWRRHTIRISEDDAKPLQLLILRCRQLPAQMGRHSNVAEAFRVAATGPEGMRGLFRGTGALLSREVPFYMFGMVGYQQLKKVFNGAVHTWEGRKLCSPHRGFRPATSSVLVVF